MIPQVIFEQEIMPDILSPLLESIALLSGALIQVSKYYAYDNLLGIDFHPVTANPWTENGPEYGHEINLVKPGINSSWSKYGKNEGM